MHTEQRISAVLDSLGQHATAITLIKQQNDVYRISCEHDTFFLKTYTKPWYGDDPAQTGFNAHHEATAWAILRQRQIAVPKVLSVATDGENALERPYVLTHQLRGESLIDALERVNRQQQAVLLTAVGQYLRQLHAITFDFAGYLTTIDGPQHAPDPHGWQHRCWSAQQRQATALAQIAQDAPTLTPQTAQMQRGYVPALRQRLPVPTIRCATPTAIATRINSLVLARHSNGR